MSLPLRIAFALRRAADAIEGLHRRSQPRLNQWEINRRAKQFVADHAHLDIEALTDLAIGRGIYTSKLPRKNIAWKMHWLRTMRVLPPPSEQSKIANRNSKILPGELLKS